MTIDDNFLHKIRKNEGKRLHLDKLVQDFKVLSRKQIILIDDQEKNCVEAIKEGSYAISVGTGGFSMQHLKTVPLEKYYEELI